MNEEELLKQNRKLKKLVRQMAHQLSVFKYLPKECGKAHYDFNKNFIKFANQPLLKGYILEDTNEINWKFL